MPCRIRAKLPHLQSLQAFQYVLLDALQFGTSSCLMSSNTSISLVVSLTIVFASIRTDSQPIFRLFWTHFCKIFKIILEGFWSIGLHSTLMIIGFGYQ